MIVDSDIKPEYQIYCIGAQLIEVILDLEEGNGVEVLVVFDAFCQRSDAGADSFALALDWLYLIGAIELREGVLRICS